MRPLVTALVDTFNHERYIEQAVVSVLEQDFPASDLEILVVDDGSTDRTPEIVRKFAPRVRLLRKKNGGQASAFNAAFPESRGEIVAFLDGDDWFAPDKLTAVVNGLERYPEAAGTAHGLYEFHENTNEIRIRTPVQPEFLDLATPEAARRACDGLAFTLTSTITVRRKVLQQLIPIPEELVFCADNPIIVASLAGGLYLLDRPLSYYRVHASNLCAPVSAEDPAKVIRRRHIAEKVYRQTGPLLSRLNVSPESAAAFLYPSWIQFSRHHLQAYGGSRLETFRTEMRAFRFEHKNPTRGYRLFKYLFVGSSTLLLPPRVFYKARDWYGQQNLGRFREQLARSR
jgi:glycosyltransferase involved in cell wall biosynthesis